ncbi:hypothetical protein SY83_11150 [Paenibacillus swuensis]|uniref:G5 domain-containing protein n=1 Tax=Paenibacillus swuensis TaxID=1178515 RepID=A0A172TIP6_9BACL|nr:VanW family protein [Paenibacillus swuensis]ANE46737.1 hypothetical protein SY83_11150 [Paenibacillus swuensis]
MVKMIAVFTGIFVLLVMAVYGYGVNGRLPDGVNVSGWLPGKMRYPAFQKALASRLDALDKQTVYVSGGQKIADAAQELGLAEPVRPGVTFTLRQLGVRWNAQEIEAELAPLFQGTAWSRARARWRFERELTLTARVDTAALQRTVDAAWAPLQRTQPADAERRITAGDRVVYKPHRAGYRVDTAKLAQALTARLPGPLWAAVQPAPPLRQELALRRVEPPLTLAKLQARGVRGLVSAFSTPIRSKGAGREHNMSAAAQQMYDMELAPGAVFDYARVIKAAEKNFGFRAAPVILNGKMVPGVGGGICQVSSTLYAAALRLGLEIVERRNHSLPVSYATLGQDATYAGGYINFKFKNTTGHHLVIRTYLEDGRVVAKLFGSMPEGVSYDIVSKTVKTLAPKVKYVRNTSLPIGSEQVLQKGKEGYVVETYRYKKMNGRIVSSERISKDTYKAQPALVAANTGNTPLPNPAEPRKEPDVIEDGVAVAW